MVNNFFLFYQGSIQGLFLLLFIENLLIALAAVIMGVFVLKSLEKPFVLPDKRERKFFALTILLNTALTYFGFLLWDAGFIKLHLKFDFNVLADFFFLAIVMDFASWILHYILHSKFLFRHIHHLSHACKNLNPANLFVIHPIETLMFGFVWIFVLSLLPFNIYAIILYMVFNIIMGIIANLGINYRAPQGSFTRFFISPAFRLEHHSTCDSNFGYHTKIWDTVFKTLSSTYSKLAKNTL